MGFVNVWQVSLRCGMAGLVSRELVSHVTVGLVLFWFGMAGEASWVLLGYGMFR